VRLFFALILATLLLPVVSGEDHTVLVSQSADGSSYYFEPEVLNIAVGDNVAFVWLNGSHNVAQSSDSASNVYLAGGFSWEFHKQEVIGHYLQITLLRMELCITFVSHMLLCK